MSETSGSCAIPNQAKILDKYSREVSKKPVDNKAEPVVINEPKQVIDSSKKVCFYA